MTPSSPTFFSAPAVDQPRASHVAMLGVPFDALSTEQAGSSRGPGALRRATAELGRYRVSDGRSIDWTKGIIDLGDITANRFDVYSSFEPLHDAVASCLAASAIPLTVGGDHSLTYATVSAAAEYLPDLRLIQIDAHHDATDPGQWRCRYNHGTFVRNLIEDGKLSGEQIVQVGVRDFQWRDSGAAFLKQHAATVISMDQIDETGLAPLLERLHTELDRPTYVTLDIDSIDPAFAPGTGEHMCGGFTSREILRIVRSLFDGSVNLIGADLVEVCPTLDPSGRTVSLASQLLGLMADGLRQMAKR